MAGIDDLNKFSTPLPSGFRRLSDEEEELHRRQHAEMVKTLLPKIEEFDRCRRRAEAESRTAFIG